MHFTFLHQGLEMDGDSLSKGPLGGTETALIGVARALAKNPENTVVIFTNTPGVAHFSNVEYRPAATLATWSLQNQTDVFISIRQWMPFLLPLRARFRVYFSPDAYDQPFLHRAFDVTVPIQGENVVLPLFSPNHFLANIDAIFCVGQWQAHTFSSLLNFPKEKIHVTANGYFPEFFQPLPAHERLPRLIYSSTPFRGLDHLLRLFPAIKQEHSSAQLEVCSGMGVYGVGRDEDQQTYGHLYQALLQVGAISHGSIKQSDLARIMCAAKVCAYPNTFAETFCISVLEAQAAGLPVVTSKLGALPERVSHGVDGFLIDGLPGQSEYDKNFVQAIGALLNNEQLWIKMSEAAQQKASHYSYDNLALQWQDYFQIQLRNRNEASYPADQSVLSLNQLEVPFPKNPTIKIKLDRKTLCYFLNAVFSSYGFGQFVTP